MAKNCSRADTALHRNVHDRNHPIARGARLARHLVVAAWRPLRALEDLLDEVERTGSPVNRLVVLRARQALENARPYLRDEDGSIWK
jgi:hypothetical protein